jgi:hypothetical protein
MQDPHSRSDGQAFLNALGRLYAINLPQRADRRRSFARQLDRIGLSFSTPGVRLFPAVRPLEAAGFPTIGARGCYLSHLGVLTDAAAEDAQAIIVCEDDLDFAPDFRARLPGVLAEAAQQPWDILYLGHDGLQNLSPDPKGKALVLLAPHDSVRSTHFLVFRRSVQADLIAYLQAILQRPPGHPDGGPMHVDGAFTRFRADRPDIITLAAIPPLGHQRPSRTDIHDLRWHDRVPGLRGLVNLARQVRHRLGQTHKQKGPDSHG